jgi:AbrB family looped-hinge helix DNA binding protein
MRLTIKTARILSKGQLTIPTAIRRELGMKAGDQLEIQVVDDESFYAQVIKRTSQEADL